jgi:hypothetical protein
VGNGCISAHPTIEDAPGVTVQFLSRWLSRSPPLIRFGTSTWTYEGWQSHVYKWQYAKSTFARECLGEYCQYQQQGLIGHLQRSEEAQAAKK